MMKIECIRQGMNRYGKEGIPFLFGVNFEMTKGFLIKNPVQNRSIFFKIGNATNMHILDDEVPPPVPQLQILQTAYKSYEKKFQTVMDGLSHGNSFLVNLTERTPIDINLSMSQIFRYSQAPYKILSPGKYVCFSPEPFVKMAGNTIYSYPMKGTINASLPEAAKLLMKNQKEQCEHNTIVDLIRNDLSMVARQVEVKRFRYIEKIKNLQGEILQTSSEITGQLEQGYQAFLGDIIFKLLPAGSISGAPKSATISLIREAEKIPRGYYTGIFGYFDGYGLDSSVMIRYIEKEGNRYYFRSGGGVTARSCPEAEYQEILDKIYLSIPTMT